MKQRQKSNSMFLLVLLIIFLTVKLSHSVPMPFKTYHVKIVNQLRNGKPLDVHCKSGDKDFGLVQVRSLADSFEFGFHINYFGTTLYFCNLWYWDFHVVFDAFRADDKFVIGQCGGNWCNWEARDDGIYLYNTEKKRQQFKYKWGKQTKV